jgi:hypothetical protein
MSSRWVDQATNVRVAPAKFCPRKMTPSGFNTKRYAHWPKPLLAYILVCPSCGFSEMQMHDKMGYVELRTVEPPVLVSTERKATCQVCKRAVFVRDGVLVAETVPV